MFWEGLFGGWPADGAGSEPGGWLEGFRKWLMGRKLAPDTVERHVLGVRQYDEYVERRGTPAKQLDAACLRRLRDEFCASIACGEQRRRRRTAVDYLFRYAETASGHAPPASSPVDPPLIRTHLDWLQRSRCLAPATLRKHAAHLRRFLDRSKTEATAEGLRALTPRSIEKYLVEDRGADGRSAPRHLRSALRSFFRFCHARGYIVQRLDLAVPPMRSYRLARAPRGLTDEQARQVVESVERSTPHGRRDYAILQMLRTYGVRGGQVRMLRLTDIDWRASTIRFRAVKGGNPSLLPLTEAVGESLLDYLRHGRPASSHPEVFLRLLSPFAPLASTSGFSSLVARRARAAGLEGRWCGHAFRHGFATRLLAAGHSLKAIADLVGHRSLSSTFVYAKVDFNALREAALDWPEEVTP